MDESAEKPRSISRRGFLRGAGAALAALAGHRVIDAIGTPPADQESTVGPTNQTRSELVTKKTEAPAVAEQPAVPRNASFADILGENHRVLEVTQQTGQEYPPQDVEYGPGFSVVSRMTGANLPVLEQTGRNFYYRGVAGEAITGGTVLNESGGVTVVQGSDSEGKGPSYYAAVRFGVGLGGQALEIMLDHARDYQASPDDPNLFIPESAVVTLRSSSGEETYNISAGERSELTGGAYYIPLQGLRVDLPEGINGQNLLQSSGLTYNAISGISVSLREAGTPQQLDFTFTRAEKPEPTLQG